MLNPSFSSTLLLLFVSGIGGLAMPGVLHQSARARVSLLDEAVAVSSIGGSLDLAMAGSPRDPDPPVDWFAECVVTQNCIQSAEHNHEKSCPTSFQHFGQLPDCPPKQCIFSCDNNLPSGLCSAFAWTTDCLDTTLTNSPGVCGTGVIGECFYEMFWHEGTSLTTCTKITQCNITEETINCGVARSCETVE